MASSGNTALRAARQALGIRSQTALAARLTDIAREIGLRAEVSPRTVRRWESADAPWPHPDHAAVLEALFHRPLVELGFTPPWSDSQLHRAQKTSLPDKRFASGQGVASRVENLLPDSVATDFATITMSHRHLYWSIPASRLHSLVAEHTRLGIDLIPQVSGASRSILARAVSESGLLSGRLEFFDLQLPKQSQASLVIALRAAHEAADSLLAAAALAHMAFAPAFSGDPTRTDEARERLRAARAFARRGDANPEFNAWLDAVEAEVETKFGNTRQALSLIRHAEESYADVDAGAAPSPAWLDWFSPTRLAGFKGNTLLAAGCSREARETLAEVIAELPESEIKQKSIYLADAAAACVQEKNPTAACALLQDALDLLASNWYAVALDRIKQVRTTLRQWDSLPEVRALDARLYDWHITVNSLV